MLHLLWFAIYPAWIAIFIAALPLWWRTSGALGTSYNGWAFARTIWTAFVLVAFYVFVWHSILNT